MRWARLFVSVWFATSLAACGGPAPVAHPIGSTPADEPGDEPVGTLADTRANDCPPTLGPWAHELFPACPPPQYGWQLPMCRGATCDRPCAATREGFAGSMGRITYDDALSFTYDANGRFLASTVNGTPELTCTWERDRLATCQHTEHGALMRVTRDGRGRITRLFEGADSDPLSYDDAGRVVAIGGLRLAYDRNGWLTTFDNTPVEHDAQGHVIREGSGDRATTYAYDRDRLVHVNARGIDIGITYDDRGRPLTISRTGLETSITTTFRYACP